MDVAVWLAEAVIEDDDENLTEAEIDELFEATQPIGNAINALAQAEVVLAEAAATARAEGSPMDDNDTPPPDWAGTPLRRIWPALTADERAEILTSRDDTALARLAADLRRTDSAESLGARPGGMFALDSDPSMKWHAERFEEPWNGWAAPVVTRETAENLFEDLEPLGNPGTVGADGVITVYRDPDDDGDYEIWPDDAGLYHLVELGWTFIRVD